MHFVLQFTMIMKSRKTLLFVIGIIVSALVVTAAVILIRKNDNAKDSTEAKKGKQGFSPRGIRQSIALLTP